jgi:excisionase family DNA binding protein
MSDLGRFLTVREAARQLGYTQKYVRDLLYEQRFPGAYKERTGRRIWRVPVIAVESHLRIREAQSNGHQ